MSGHDLSDPAVYVCMGCPVGEWWYLCLQECPDTVSLSLSVSLIAVERDY